MNTKGQGALEYLLLIGGAVLVAAIVIALITGIPTTTPNPSTAAICAAQATCDDCVTETIGGVAGACRAQLTDGTTINPVPPAVCTAAQRTAYRSCVPD